MGRPAVFLALMLAFGATASFAAESENFQVKTTRDLVTLCSAKMGDADYDAAKGYCLGFIDAAHDYHAVITSGDMLRPITCPGKMTTRQQVIDMFLAWARNNEGLLDGESPIQGLMRAASARWPC